jgi:hypothetical protein
MPSGCDLAAPLPKGDECDQEDCSISQGNGFRSVAGGWETFENVTGNLSAAGALDLPSGDYHGQMESLLDTRIVAGGIGGFPIVQRCPVEEPPGDGLVSVCPPYLYDYFQRSTFSRRASHRLNR